MLFGKDRSNIEKNFNSSYSRQIGEHLAVAELGRRRIIASPFAGNVPDIDVLAYRGGKSIPIQVKALSSGSWSFQITSFCEVTMENDSQVIGAPREWADAETIFIFIKIAETAGEDQFYILTWRDLRDICIKNHRAFLERNGGQRPRNPKSMHVGISPSHLAAFHDNWGLVDIQFC